MSRKNAADPARLRYKHHRAVDDQCGVITAIETTAGDVVENHKLMDLVEQHEANTGQQVGVVVADAQYGTNDNFAACQQRQIRSHMKDLRSTFDHHEKRGIFQETDFQYDEQTQSYVCPAGKTLKRSKTIERHYYVFRSNANVCAQCALRPRCMTSKKHVRKLKRHVAHEQVEKGRAESHSGWARRDRRRRKHLMEGSFADAANRHGFKRARWRRLRNQHIQDLLIATCQNIRILVRNRRINPAVSMKAAIPVETRFLRSLAPLGILVRQQ
jgi:hypothetical protein